MSGILIPHKTVNLGMHVLDWANLGSPARENYLSHLQAVGIHGVRTPFIWGDLLDPKNPNAGANYFTYAQFVQGCYQRGITCTAVIHSDEPAGFVRDQHLYDLAIWVYQRVGPSGDWWSQWGFPTDRAVNLYEIYNEPNSRSAYGDTAYGSTAAGAVAYGNMIKPIYQQLRCANGPGGSGTGYNDARVRVVGGGLKQSDTNPPDVWINDWINGGTLWADHICVHPYPTNYDTVGNANAKAMLKNCRAVLDSHSATQQLIITEYAYPVTGGQAAQLSGWQDFRNFVDGAGYALHAHSWFPAVNSVAEGFTGDCRLATTSDWVAFSDRSVMSSFSDGASESWCVVP